MLRVIPLPVFVVVLEGILLFISGAYLPGATAGATDRNVNPKLAYGSGPLIEENVKSEIEVEEGNYTTLRCIAYGSPKPRITWQKGSIIIDRPTGRYKLTDDIMQIVGLLKSDSGTYTCVAENEYGRATKQYKLTVKDGVNRAAEILEEPVPNITVKLGAPAVLQCYAYGYPSPVVTWWKEEKLLPMNTEQYELRRDHSLVIRYVTLRLLGPYTCQAYNGLGRANSWTTTLHGVGTVKTLAPEDYAYTIYLIPDPQVPPSSTDVAPVTDSPPHTLHVVPVQANINLNQTRFANGADVSIPCEVEGYPTPEITWSKNGEKIESNTKISISEQNVLVIRSADGNDSGEYKCSAANAFSVSSSSINIVVEGFYSVSIRPPEFSGYVGETARFQCIANPQDGQSRYEWSRSGNRPLPQTATSDQYRGILTISNAAPVDAGEYVCSVLNTITGAVVGRSEAYVKVNPRDDTDQENKAPTISIDPVDQKVPQGSLAIIRCTSSDPKAQITWRKMHDNINSTSDIQIRGSEIRIPSMQVKHRGSYVCIATNPHGSVQAYSKLEIERREAPSIEIYPNARMPVMVGTDPLLIQCKVNRGVPSPQLRWYRPGNLTMSPRVSDLKNGVIKFTNVTEGDEGEYVCSAENGVGHAEAVAFLEVILPPRISLNPVGPLTVRVNDSVQLECRAEGRPIPRVLWRSASLPVSPYDVSPVSSRHSAVYEIPRVQISDAGVYTCTASNSVGHMEEQVQLTVTAG